MYASCPSGISPALRKTAVKLKLKKVIEESGDVCSIKTQSALKNYNVSFTLGHQFEEVTRGLDNQHLKVEALGGWRPDCSKREPCHTPPIRWFFWAPQSDTRYTGACRKLVYGKPLQPEAVGLARALFLPECVAMAGLTSVP